MFKSSYHQRFPFYTNLMTIYLLHCAHNLKVLFTHSSQLIFTPFFLVPASPAVQPDTQNTTDWFAIVVAACRKGPTLCEEPLFLLCASTKPLLLWLDGCLALTRTHCRMSHELPQSAIYWGRAEAASLCAPRRCASLRLLSHHEWAFWMNIRPISRGHDVITIQISN